MLSAPATLPRLRLGAVPYLNAKPLVAPLRGRPGLDLAFDLPSRLGEALRGGGLDLGLLPAFDILAHPGTRAVDGVAIGSDGPVRSVLLYCRVPPARIRSLAPDPASLSSNALARILLAEAYGLSPAGAAPAEADARILIGDAALRGLPGAWEEVLDLGGAWQRLTGLPFVYALWAARPGALPAGAAERLREAGREGTSNMEALARAEAGAAGIPPEAAAAYLREAIRYGLGERERQGLAAFASLLKAQGLLARPAMPAWI